MSALLKALLVKLVRGNWGRVFPLFFKAVAEGQFGKVPKEIYWFLAGRKTVLGAILIGVGTGLEAVCSSHPSYAWTCEAGTWVYWLGGMLAAVGLIDGGTRSPWPTAPDGGAPQK